MPKIEPGDLFEVNWPFTDQSQFKRRPAVALGAEDSFYDVELLMITTQRQHDDCVELTAKDYATATLPKSSFVRIGRPLKIRMDRLTPLNLRLTTGCISQLRKSMILRDARIFSNLTHRANRPGSENAAPFEAGKTVVPYAGRVFTEDEVESAIGATLDFWLTLGPEGDALENELAAFLKIKKSILVNSGSSANLLAFSALTSSKLGERRLRPGDEVITVAAGFPTTVAPIIQNGCVPVFIDNDPFTLNGRVEQLAEAFVPGKTKAVMMAHTLGNPFDLSAVTEFCRKHNLWLIEDNCDALGCTYDGQLTGTFGDLSTQSFYPPHHITMGEGGAVNIVRDMKLKVLVESFRDWGRDCWCASGKDNTCNKRFGWQLGELPEGYDHKYIYSHLGYNLKPLDTQAAIGRQQLKKLPSFVEARKKNWEYLRRGLDSLGEFFEFMLPTHAKAWKSESRSLKSEFIWDDSGHRVEASWFGFMMRVKPTAPFSRTEFARALDANKIGNRMLFGGNLVRQPAFVQLRKENPKALRIVGDMSGADKIMNESVFIGVYPGLTKAMLDYMVESITQFVRSK